MSQTTPASEEPAGSAPVEEILAVEPVSQSEMLAAKAKGGANWFFWIAALSAVNSAITLLDGDRHFVVGLGITQIIDGIASAIGQQTPEISTIVRGVALAISLAISSVVALFGWMSRKGFLAVFAIGMGLYLLDGLLFVLFQDWMSAGFHAFALVCMWGGFSAWRQLKSLDSEAAFAAAGADGGSPS